MAVSISDRIQSMVDHMDNNEIELALSDVCIAIDITSKRHYGRARSSSTLYKNFVKENLWIIIFVGTGTILTDDIKIPFVHEDIKSSNDGYCTLEDIIYHVIRCGYIHDTGEHSKIKWNNKIPFAVDKDGYLYLTPSFIWAFALCVIACEENRDERVRDTCWVSMASFKYLINDMWGKRESIRSMILSQYGIAVKDFFH
ncbi:MAG: hypothetical protein ABFC31_01490 [Clostridiaceae bacterium]